MTPDGWLVSVVAVVGLGALMAGRASLDAVGLGLIVALVALGLIDLDTALAGFGNHAVVTLAGLYVIGEALAHTGALDFVAGRLLHHSGGRELRLTMGLCLIVALVSGIASNTAVVLVFIPLAFELARGLEVPASRLLMPMAFSSILGGTLTLVGSTTNLLASGSGEAFGAQPFGLFTMTPVALALVLVGVPVTVLLARRVLPERRSLTADLAATPAREFVTELRVGPDSPLVGRPLGEALSRDGARPLLAVRREQVLWPPLDEQAAEAGDTILLRGKVEVLLELQRELELDFLNDTRFDPRTMQLFELVVSPSSQLIGLRLGALHLFRDFGVLVVAILRGGHHYRGRAADMHLRAGDVLLVCGPEEAEARVERSQDFYRLRASTREPRLPGAARRALAIGAAMVVLFVLGALPSLKPWLPLPLVVLGGAMAMVAARCINTRRAYRGIGWGVLVFVVGALALGEALQAAGVTELVAGGIVGTMSRFGAAGTLSGLLLAGTLLNQVVSPYAVSVLLAPIAISTAASLGHSDPTPFLLAVAFAGSNAFATPLGHQVNLLVLGPGGYRTSDFLRLGIPICILYWLVASVGLALYVS